MYTFHYNCIVAAITAWLALCAASAQAQTRELSIPFVEGRPGDTVEIPVSIDNGADVVGINLFFNIPNTTPEYPLEFIEVDNDETLLDGWVLFTNDRTTDQGRLVVTSANIDPLTGSGVLFKLIVRIKDNALRRTVPLEFEPNSSVNDGRIEAILTNGTVFVNADPVTPPPLPTGEATPRPSPTGPPPTATPEGTPPSGATPTPAPPTPTPTGVQLNTTPRPGNRPPGILARPGASLTVLLNGAATLLVVANDPDGDAMEVTLSPNAPVTRTEAESLPGYRLAEYTLDTSSLGDASFTVYANDGNAVTQLEISYRVAETLEPGDPAAAPAAVFVTDDEHSEEDLTGSTDLDGPEERQLTVRWTAPGNNATDWHVYVREDFGPRVFLGRAGSGDADRLDWYPGNRLIQSEWQDGPRFGHFYLFDAVRIDGRLSEDDFFAAAHSVGFNTAEGGPLDFGAVPVAVTDDPNAAEDLSGRTDFDDVTDRQLSVKWNLPSQGALDWHVYVRDGFGERRFLGRAGGGTRKAFHWYPNAPRTAEDFLDGPRFGASYTFQVVRIDGNPSPDDRFGHAAPVGYNRTGGAPVPPPENPVIVTDDEVSEADLTGLTDFDAAENRQLTLKWNLPARNAVNWHVYVRRGLDGRKYLGNTGGGEAGRFDWRPGAPRVSPEFAGGPEFNSFYNFRLVRIDGEFGTDDIYDQAFAVGFNRAGGEAVPLARPKNPDFNARRVAVFDDFLGGEDLAPSQGEGVDIDPPERRFLHIAWDFNDGREDFTDYHLFVRTGGDPEYEFLGQTNDGELSYFWWANSLPFATASKFAQGPVDGSVYQFMVARIPERSSLDRLTGGRVRFFTDPALSTPTRTPAPTFTPAPPLTPTAVPPPTPTPSNSPTPTPTPEPAEEPFSLIPANPGGSALRVVLPGVTDERKPFELALIRPGGFTMGSPAAERGHELDEGPQHPVTISRHFYMGVYEITQAQWRAVMGNNPAWFNGDPDHPVESVSWEDCRAFFEELNRKSGSGRFRLPTEAEWEYACRAGTEGRFSFGDALDCGDAGEQFCPVFDAHMWWLGNNTFGSNPYGTKPVGEKRPNAFGLHDMHGNVFEWCADWFGPYGEDGVIDPAGPEAGTRRVVRGGSWSGAAAVCRSANRQGQPPANRYVNVGFRAVWRVE